MGEKKNKIIGAIASLILIVILAIAKNNPEVANKIATSANDNTVNEVTQNVENNSNTSEENVNGITVQTGESILKQIPNDNNLRVFMLDVGQGDSILISNNNKNVLIDASTNEMGSKVVENLKKLGINKIDYLVGTHPHEDHIGGLDNVINSFDIGTIYMPKVSTNTKTFEDVLKAVEKKKLKINTPKVGDKFNLDDAEFEVMSIGDNKEDLNSCSIVLKLECNNHKYLFTGDAESSVENARKWPEVDVLKVGHHGAKTSSTQKFLNQVKPKIALISVGQGNSYGHPKEETLKKLNKIGSKIYRTDEVQTVELIDKK